MSQVYRCSRRERENEKGLCRCKENRIIAGMRQHKQKGATGVGVCAQMGWRSLICFDPTGVFGFWLICCGCCFQHEIMGSRMDGCTEQKGNHRATVEERENGDRRQKKRR